MRRRFFNSRINNNFIIYTSSDNLIVIPFKYDFGATIISNAINNNVGKITFNSDVTIIGNSAFSNCYNLTSIEIPNSVTSIGDSAFYYCENLTSVVIGNSVTNIESNAFAWCYSLKNIVIPDSVTSIGNEAFYECSRLSLVYVKATTPPTLGKNAFDNNAPDRKFYVPRASLNAYKTASGWSEYSDAIEPYDFNGGGLFYVHCEGISSDTYTFTIDSQKTWGECVGLKDDTGVAEISPYEEVVPGSGVYRFHIYVDLHPSGYAIEVDEDGNVPTPKDKIKINTTYQAYEF